MVSGGLTAATAREPVPYTRGTLALRLVNAPIPRTEHWRISMNICDWDIAVGATYDELFTESELGTQFHIGPGQHDLAIRATKPGTRGWSWNFPVVIPGGADTLAIERTLCVDTVSVPEREPSFDDGEVTTLAELYGVAEVLQPQSGTRAPAHEGMQLPPGSVIVVGPKSNAIVECARRGQTHRVLLRPGNMLLSHQIGPGRLDDFELTPQAEVELRPHDRQPPRKTLTGPGELRHMDIDFGGPDWHACCSVRG